MRYNKPPLSFEQQADRLLQRGLEADRDALICVLQNVSYYRLSGYLYPYRDEHDNFKIGTSLAQVWDHYCFDRQLRLLVLDAIERVEIAVKARITTLFTCENQTGFPHLQQKYFDSNCDVTSVGFLVSQIRNNASKSREVFIDSFKRKYSNKDLPLWMAAEIMTFGNLYALYKCLSKHEQVKIADAFFVPAKVFDSWMLCLNYVRNLCAHHSRLWNRELAIKPFIPRNNKDWHDPVEVLNHQGRIFSVLTVLKYMVSINAPNSRWAERLVTLLSNHPQTPFSWMGFPANWGECPLWKNEPQGGRV